MGFLVNTYRMCILNNSVFGLEAIGELFYLPELLAQGGCLSNDPAMVYAFETATQSSIKQTTKDELYSVFFPEVELVNHIDADADGWRRAALFHLDALYGFAMTVTRNTHDVEDLVQETYLITSRRIII